MQPLIVIFLFASLIGLILAFFKPRLLNRIFRLNLAPKRLRLVFAVLAVVFFFLIGVTPNNRQDQPPQKELYSVAKVVDGDTLDVSIAGKTERIRLIGINTPETVDPRKPVECFGKEASNKAKELLEGKRVFLEADPSQGERDKYDRLLRYVFLEDGQSFNKLMISEGYAYEYTYDTPYKYQAEYKAAQREAEQGKHGLWADGACSSTKILPLDDYLKQPPNNNPPTISGGDKDCPDFSSHAEAQAYFEAGGGGPSYNFNNLDRDRDGIACETLP